MRRRRYDWRGRSFQDWPPTDRELWQRLVRKGDVFDEDGALSHLRPRSQVALQNAYGFFLGHLTRLGVDLDTEHPRERPSIDRLRSYAEAIAELAPRTKSNYFLALHRVLQAAFPDRDWRVLGAAAVALLRCADAAGGVRDKSRIPTADALLDLGLAMIAEVRAGGDRLDHAAAEQWRDGLMIAFLATHPLRILNFAMLEIGRTIRATGGCFHVSIPATEMKAARPFDFAVAPMIADEINAYLDHARPIFPGGQDRHRGRLWLARHGEPWAHKKIGRRISAVTERRLGVRVTPHNFRDAAATTLALTPGADARLAKPLLGHVTTDMAERCYNQATQLDASRRYNEVLKGLHRWPEWTSRGTR